MRTGRWILIFILVFLPAPCLARDALRLPSYDAGVFDPVKGPVTVKYRLLKDAGEVVVLVEDFRGQIIERLYFVDLGAGDHQFSWKGMDENGEKLPDGRYRFNLKVRFSDGANEEAHVAVRITTLPEKAVLPPPMVLPPRKYAYKIDGSASTLYIRDTEGGKKDEDGEQRLRMHLSLSGKDRVADGLFSMRRPYSRQTTYDGSRAMAVQRWAGGKIKGVFRQGLGTLDDPMKLFSDFRTARKKEGARIDHEWGRLGMSAIGYRAEGDVEGREKGIAGRVTLGAPGGWKFGLTCTRRRAVPSGESCYETSSAVAGDARVPILSHLNLEMEYTATRDIEKRKDHGCVIRLLHDRGGIRASGGYIDLGEHFSAEYADPLHHVRRDARGGEINIDYRASRPVWRFKNVSGGMRLFAVKRHSTHKKIREGDGSFRFVLGDADRFLFNWFGREADGSRSNSLLFSGRHAWKAAWSSGLQAGSVRTKTSCTWRWMMDLSFSEPARSCRLALERTRRVIEGADDSPYEEWRSRLDVRRGPWRLMVSGTHGRRNTDSGDNFFVRIAYGPRFLHRYHPIAYLALGDRSAFETQKRVEMGLEVRF